MFLEVKNVVVAERPKANASKKEKPQEMKGKSAIEEGLKERILRGIKAQASMPSRSPSPPKVSQQFVQRFQRMLVKLLYHTNPRGDQQERGQVGNVGEGYGSGGPDGPGYQPFVPRPSFPAGNWDHQPSFRAQEKRTLRPTQLSGVSTSPGHQLNDFC
jgi:hypothetical protein